MQVEDERLGLTPTGRDVIGSVRGGSVFDEWRELERRLRELGAPDPDAGQGLPLGAYERAVSDYLGEASRALGEL